MKNISIRSTAVLSVIAIITIVALVLVENLKSYKKQQYYYEKIEAAHLNRKLQKHLKQTFFKDEIIINNINDPNNTGLIGQQFTEITSGRGSLPIKLSTLNPNFSAMVVQQIKDAGLKKGDKVAMCFTGSFPALNMAVIAAVETLELRPVLITSVTSSSWGANDANLTWIDMQNELYKSKLVSFMPIASSIGGNQDIGVTLSKDGRQKAIIAIQRNNISLIKGNNLEDNIAERMALFNAERGIKLFINVGGGVASLGSHNNSKKLPSGFRDNLKHANFIDKQGIVYEMVKQDIPIINLLNIDRLLKRYQLPRDPLPLPKPGEGALYNTYKYDLLTVGITTALLIGLLIIAMYYDKKQNALGTQIIKTQDA
ncbi:poly-gamma-glutamate system protein [Winogradskyella haliclonae]|uniref:Poly-gamma-glutamate system protein n=1 Tax=Winogradskyella haliclonae TaxID=2048558 RepID=A0ABQ2BTC2_9FLAO|nr:poly-gamma-glutamate system protein [Winogradskyella haliclonae]GGI55736.1 poly-gamma-glutamate system protein [Winogradskyella haliclonae]